MKNSEAILAERIDRLEAMFSERDRLYLACMRMKAAIKPVLDEAAQRADYMHDTWNLDAHVELTLTIGEIRALRAALDATKEQK